MPHFTRRLLLSDVGGIFDWSELNPPARNRIVLAGISHAVFVALRELETDKGEQIFGLCRRRFL
jgi:hypothetical protein